MNDIHYLSHGGPGSGRYPLGSGERPYQKFEGAGGLRSGISGYVRARRAKKAEAKERKAMNEELKKKQHDADKERVLREGSATEVMKYQGELTNKELQDAFTRLNLETQLRNFSDKETKTAIDRVDDISRALKTGTEFVKTGIDIYNTFATVYNSTPNGRENPLILVGKKK